MRLTVGTTETDGSFEKFRMADLTPDVPLCI